MDVLKHTFRVKHVLYKFRNCNESLVELRLDSIDPSFLTWAENHFLPGHFSLNTFLQYFSGLKCVCQLCEHTNFTCQTEGACWTSVMLTNGKEEVIKSCVSLPELNAQVFCHSSKNVTKTECCYTDFCNNITLHLPTGKQHLTVRFSLNNLSRRKDM